MGIPRPGPFEPARQCCVIHQAGQAHVTAMCSAFTHPFRVPIEDGWTGTGGIASLDPRLISVTPIGVGVLSAPRRHQRISQQSGPPCPALGAHPRIHVRRAAGSPKQGWPRPPVEQVPRYEWRVDFQRHANSVLQRFLRSRDRTEWQRPGWGGRAVLPGPLPPDPCPARPLPPGRFRSFRAVVIAWRSAGSLVTMRKIPPPRPKT
jgi:hypothetical protein